MGVKRWSTMGMGFGLLLFLSLSGPILSQDAPRMNKEELKAMMGGPDLVLIDVRAGNDWNKSKEKIRGAVREEPGKNTASWADKYPKSKTIVLYCA